MKIDNIQLNYLFEEFNKVIEKAQDIAIFTRNISIQFKEIEILKEFIEKAEIFKVANRDKCSENELNLILCLIISADTILSEISMIICFKKGDMDGAWSNLIQAQNQISVVARNHPLSNGDFLKGYISKLNMIEKILFPRMNFSSIGGIIKKTSCNICKLEYEECDHIKGKMYMGELCVCEVHEIELEEISMVNNPSDKMCRVLSTTREDKVVDVLTLMENPKRES